MKLAQRRIAMLVVVSAVLTVAGEIAFWHFRAISNPASAESADVNSVFSVLFRVGLPFFVVPTTALIMGLIFSRQKNQVPANRVSSIPALEAAWTFIPLAIIIGVAVFGGVKLLAMEQTGQNELEIQVTASQYAFQFYYPEYGIKSFELVVPVNQRVDFSMTSEDVVHDFWVPQWGPKQDLLPGMTTNLLITPTEIGDFTVICSQLCGVGHTYMSAPVQVLSQSGFAAWASQQQKTPAATPGMS